MSTATTGPGAQEVHADAVAAAAAALPEVASLASTGLVPVATYLPGRRVLGVRVDDAALTVAVVGQLWTPVATIASAVRRAVMPLAGGRRIDVHVEDVAAPGERPGH